MCKMGMSKDSFHDNGKFQLHECPNGLCSSFCKQIDLIQMLMYNLFLIKIEAVVNLAYKKSIFCTFYFHLCLTIGTSISYHSSCH